MQTDTVVIYELDTPVVSDTIASVSLALGASRSLGSLFAATDPAGRAIVDWQVYNGLSTDALVVGGTDYTGHNSPASAISATSLAGISLLAGATAGTDTLEVRASNGSYWGDWQSLAVTVSGAAPKPPVPAVRPDITVTPTAAQDWTAGQTLDFQLPANTFTDALGLPMRFTAFQVSGPGVTQWLYFDPTTDELLGQIPSFARGTMELVIVATDPSHLTGEDLFRVTLTPGLGYTPIGDTIGSPGMAVLFDPPEPANALPFHS